MSWWSKNVSGGNTLGQSIKNVFTPNDDKAFVGGKMVVGNTAKAQAEEARLGIDPNGNRPQISDPYARTAVPDSNSGGGGGGAATAGTMAPLVTTQQSAPLDPNSIIELSKKAGIPLSNTDIEEMIKDPQAFGRSYAYT